MVKAVEDAIVKVTGVDDSRTTKVGAEKQLVMGASRESIHVSMEVTQRPPRLCGCGEWTKTPNAKWILGHNEVLEVIEEF